MKLEILLLMMAAIGEILYVTSQECPAFKKVKFGRVKYRSRRKIARFRCRRKFTLLGAKLSICLKGKWNHPAPVCIAPGCDIPDPPPHLIMTTSKNDALISLECQQGYVLQGPESVYCDGSNWSDSLSTCNYVEPDLFCNFEESTLCGWTQYHGDNFDWTINSGSTSTDRTGPDNDHTFGSSSEGHYLYIESSSPRALGHKATILSPPYKDLPNGTCFEFYYHMKGNTGPNEVGSLFVYIRRGNQDIEELVPSFSQSSHQGEEWLRGSFEIVDVISTIQIVITGIRGESYVGDIAIDDVRLYNCSDYTDDVTTENALDSTLQWTTLIPIGSSDTSTISELITTHIDVTTIATGVTSDKSHATTLSETDMSTSPSVLYTTGMSTATPKVVDMTTESLTTEETTTEMTPQPTMGLITSKVTPEPTTKGITIESTLAAVTTTIKPTTAGTTKRSTSQTSTKTSLPTTTMPSTTTRRSTTTIPTTTKQTTITTTPKTTTTKVTTPKTTTTKVTTPKPTTTKVTTPKTTTAKTTTPKPTTTKVTTAKQTSKSTTTQSTSTSNQRKSTTTSSPITTKTTITTTLHSSETTKQASTKTTSNSAGTITTTYFDKSIPEVTRSPQDNNETDIPNVIQVGKGASQSKGAVKPLMIGIGVGVAIGLAIVLVIVFLYMKKHPQKHDDMEDEMAPIARNAYSEW